MVLGAGAACIATDHLAVGIACVREGKNWSHVFPCDFFYTCCFRVSQKHGMHVVQEGVRTTRETAGT